jgi:acetyl-CoA carboxylase biotin carboxyl carrier protein
MDPKQLKRIVEIMNQNDLAEIEIEEEGKRLRLRKREGAVTAVPVSPPPPAAPAPPAAANPTPVEAEPAVEVSEELHTITAPMVGTFYRAPSPEAEVYVSVGQRINPESVVCILEAMKVMNEIKSECSGEVVKICVQNGEAVEYDQPLFVVKTE